MLHGHAEGRPDAAREVGAEQNPPDAWCHGRKRETPNLDDHRNARVPDLASCRRGLELFGVRKRSPGNIYTANNLMARPVGRTEEANQGSFVRKLNKSYLCIIEFYDLLTLDAYLHFPLILSSLGRGELAFPHPILFPVLRISVNGLVDSHGPTSRTQGLRSSL